MGDGVGELRKFFLCEPGDMRAGKHGARQRREVCERWFEFLHDRWEPRVVQRPRANVEARTAGRFSTRQTLENAFAPDATHFRAEIRVIPATMIQRHAGWPRSDRTSAD